MARFKPFFLPLLVLFLFVSPLWAGEWVTGEGETLPQAVEKSLNAAKILVASRGKGCVGRNDGPDAQLAQKKKGLWFVQTYVSHQDDSCGKNVSEEQWIRNNAGILLGNSSGGGAGGGISKAGGGGFSGISVNVIGGIGGFIGGIGGGGKNGGGNEPQTRASRVFAGPGEYPPTDFQAYGIVAFRSLATDESIDRYLTICNGFLAGLPSASLLRKRGVSKSLQMATVWPVTDVQLSKDLNVVTDKPQLDRCREIVDATDLVSSRDAIAKAKRAQSNLAFDGRGPFLIAWSPASTVGQAGALILTWDLSDVTTAAQATLMFTDWADQIEQNPQLWDQGWNIEKIRVVLRLWADRYGSGLLSFLGLAEDQ